MRRWRRVCCVMGAVVCAVSLTVACTRDVTRPSTAPATTASTTSAETIAPADPAGLTVARVDDAVAVSSFLFEAASAVVLVSPADADAALARAGRLGVPALPDTAAGRAEARRLGARVLAPGDPAGSPATPARRSTPARIATTGAPSPLVRHLARIGDATLLRIAADPRRDRASVRRLRQDPDGPLLTLGASGYATAVVRADARAVGGGWYATRGKRLLAMYGHPSGPALGVLGEQGTAASVARVRALVRKYRRVAPETRFVPAFEIIATVATAGPGPRRDYSARTRLRDLRPLVDAAEKTGIVVILDLQPGRSSFLAQARAYEPLLRRPHVGLALDPEWRLGPKEKPLRRIGSVSAREINQVSDWLARLTRRHTLPQKVFVLHQFQTQMIRHRERVRTDHPELATIIHVDGQGPTAAKLDTWRMIRRDAPAGVDWGWKNFVDEDEPMLDVARTWATVRPRPRLITYQ